MSCAQQETMMHQPWICIATIVATALSLLDCSRTVADERRGITVVRVDENSKIVKWVQEIGSDSGPPVSTERFVVVGTGNRTRDKTRAGVVMCFDRDSGKLRWRNDHKLLPKRENNLGIGLMCEPVILQNRVFYQSNRGEAVSVDLVGDANTQSTKTHWSIDFPKEQGVFKRDAGDVGNPTPSPLLIGDRLFCVTGNGSLYGYSEAYPGIPFVPSPNAPSFVALNAKSGKVLWKSSAPGDAICYGQWGSPAHLTIDGKQLVVFPGGDGSLYLFDCESGRLLGRVALNDSRAKPWSKMIRGDVLFCSHRPLVVDQLIYVAVSHDLEASRSMNGPIICIDARELLNRSDRSKVIRWEFKNSEFMSSLGEMAWVENRLYAISSFGCLVCLDRRSGDLKWLVNQDGPGQLAGITIHKGKVYVPTLDSIWVYEDGNQPRAVKQYQFNHVMMCKPLVTDDEIFVSTSGRLWCLKNDRLLAE